MAGLTADLLERCRTPFEQAIKDARRGDLLLIAAAADRWDLDPAECDTSDGFVIAKARRLSFGELAEAAAAQMGGAGTQPFVRSSGSGYMVQVGVFGSKENADSVAGKTGAKVRKL